ncbi:protein kinase [Corallococcus sp. ZKHCc1 1396]|uniref:Protein kinase n=1 Tax=Corallococcus soli TaxID=2710757 RepID=A0ABR9PVF1_9BACT|nr:serine/threonine-protein kinase [Corallococcus soli]MBE4751917.1 protein kinase [Corallococcus soli]
MTLEAGTHVGKYVVRRKLAEGGMAEIFLCTARGPEGFEKEVVIKRVRSFLASDPDFVQMFIAEARLASRLNHANVVQIFDFDKHEDTYYLAMEYVRGCSLWELRKRSKEAMTPITPTLVAHIGVEVARGLHYAHRLRVNGELLHLVHRDVTPHNVLVSYDGAVKLTDFGIAKAGNTLTNPGVLKGKFAYMSPEQARGESVDARTDVFALGVVLWELLTGGRLFQGDSEIAVLRAVQESTIVPPARLNPDVPPELDAAICRALERDLSKRFQTAGELERALAQCVLNQARSVDDTDVGEFLRGLFPVAASNLALPAMPERTALVDGALPPPGEDAAPPPREPTAVMPSRGHASGAMRSPSPDEDLHGTTLVLGRDERAEAVNGRPPAPTPLMPLPSLERGAREPQGAPAGRRPASREVAAYSQEASEGGRRAMTPGAGGRSGAAGDASQASTSEEASWGTGADADASQGSARRSSAPGDESRGARRSGASNDEARFATRSDAGLREDDTVSATEPGPPSAPGRKRALWAGAAVLGLAGVLGVMALARSLPGAAVSGQGSSASQPAANVPVEPSRPASPDAVEAEIEGQRREAALATPPPPRKSAPASVTAAPANPPAPVAPAEDAAKALGTLQVSANPYATVYLGTKRLGDVQGRASYKVAPGTYKLTFEHPTSARSYTVVVPANGTVTQEFRASKGR